MCVTECFNLKFLLLFFKCLPLNVIKEFCSFHFAVVLHRHNMNCKILVEKESSCAIKTSIDHILYCRSCLSLDQGYASIPLKHYQKEKDTNEFLDLRTYTQPVYPFQLHSYSESQANSFIQLTVHVHPHVIVYFFSWILDQLIDNDIILGRRIDCLIYRSLIHLHLSGQRQTCNCSASIVSIMISMTFT